MMRFQAKNISSLQGRKYLFRNISFTLNSGELLHIKGQNGTGKTTLLKMLAGLSALEKGQVLFQEQNISQGKELFYSRMSYLGHKNSLKMWLTPLENIAYQLALSQQKMTLCDFFHEKVGKLKLNTSLEKPCRQLSAGQCRKVALLSMVLKNKPLWILDEPFTALDTESIDVCKAIFQGHLQAGGIIVLSSHADLTEFLAQTIDLTQH